MLDEAEVESLCEEEDEEGDVFLSDSEGHKDYVEENENARDSDPNYPDIDKSDPDNRPKQLQKKKSKTSDEWDKKREKNMVEERYS